jgi:hypothetical protein
LTYDRISIAAFVTSLLCLFPVGLGLGVAGLVRTRQRIRLGRKLAWSAVIISSIVAMGWILGQLPRWTNWSPDGPVAIADLAAGDCVSFDTSQWTEAGMVRTDCDRDPDAEVLRADRFNARLLESRQQREPNAFCRLASRPEQRQSIGADWTTLRLVLAGDPPGEPAQGGYFACLLPAG